AAGLAREDRRAGQHRRQAAAHLFQALERAGLGYDAGGVDRQRRFAGDRADIGRTVGAREDLGRRLRTVRLAHFEKYGLARYVVAGVEDEAVTLEPDYRRHAQPLRGEDR